MFDRSTFLKIYYIISYQSFNNYKTAALYENNLKKCVSAKNAQREAAHEKRSSGIVCDTIL